MKKVCYTFLFGGYDKLRDPLVVTPGWDYICISDVQQESEVWETVLYTAYESPKMAAVNALAIPFWDIEHVDDIWVCVDANIQVNCNLDDLVAEYPGDWVMLTHPNRACFYDEALACIELQKDEPTKIFRQMAAYMKEGYPADNGMVATGVIIRKMTKGVFEFGCFWEVETLRYSARDQLSFNYTMWKHPGLIEPAFMPWSILSTHFVVHDHLK